jgi:hypothetical protein
MGALIGDLTMQIQHSSYYFENKAPLGFKMQSNREILPKTVFQVNSKI